MSGSIQEDPESYLELGRHGEHDLHLLALMVYVFDQHMENRAAHEVSA